MMSKKLNSLLSIYVYSFFICLITLLSVSTIKVAAITNKSVTTTTTTIEAETNITSSTEVKMDVFNNSSKATLEKEFDKIRVYESFDPITNTWSKIEDFKNIEILEDSTKKRNENYIYRNFWAYDPYTKTWRRVYINDHGYKDAKPIPETAKTENIDVLEDASQEQKGSSSFWNKLGLTFAVGGGTTYYINQIHDLNVFIKKGEKKIFLQAPGTSDDKQGRGHLIQWFSRRNMIQKDINPNNVAHDKNSALEFEKTASGDIRFQELGFNIPITAGLHYTFFKRLRIGAGGNLGINYLKTLQSAGSATHLSEYELLDPWFYDLKWFGTLGYKVFQQSKNAIIIDTQIGIVYDLGASIKENIQQYIGSSLYVSLGIAHERKLNNYFKFFYRLAADFKQYKDNSNFVSETAFVKFFQPSVRLEIGTILNFGKEEIDKDLTNMDLIDTKLEDSTLSESLNTIPDTNNIPDPVEKVEDTISIAENKLYKAERAKRRAESAKNKFKGLFR